MCFLLYDGSELVGVCGVYVDDFIIAGSPNNRKWQVAKEKLKKLYKWGNGKRIHLLYVASDTIRNEIFQYRWTNRSSLEN